MKLFVLAALLGINAQCTTLTQAEQDAVCRCPSTLCATPDGVSHDFGDACQTGKAHFYDMPAIHKLTEGFVAQDAEKAQAQQAAAEQAQRDQRTAEEQQGSAQEEYDRKTSSPRYINRRTGKFATYQDAVDTLIPGNPGNPVLLFARDPMRLKGSPFNIMAQVVQVVDNHDLLIDPCFVLPDGTSCPAYAHLIKGYGGSHDFIDGQRILAVAEVIGTKRYATVTGAEKAVPWLVLYGAEPR